MVFHQQAAGDKRVFWIVVVCCLLLTALIVTSKLPKTKSTTALSVGRSPQIAVTVADTTVEHERGYSGHTPIDDREGMLFIFTRPVLQTFWMNKMLFDLDFIYGNNGRVVFLAQNIKAPVNNHGQIEYINSPEPFDAVLEVKSGFIRKYQIKVGDTIRLGN